jgi:glycogen(starch) synthase
MDQFPELSADFIGVDSRLIGAFPDLSGGPPLARSISVIVSTCNRAATLADCLAALQRQSFPRFEVIVVVGPCTDATPQVLQAHAPHVKVVTCAARNLSASRNLGIAAAAGDICAFIDDDAIAHPRWLERLERRYADPAVGGVGGFTLDNTGARFQCRYTVCDRFGNATLLDHVDPSERLGVPGLWLFPSLLGTNSSFRTALLRRIGGFDAAYEYMLDETDVCVRLADLGHAIVTVPDALVFHRYAESHVRDHRRIARTLLAQSRSKAHFVLRHGAPRTTLAGAAAELDRFRADLRFSNRWHVDRALIGGAHFLRLNSEIETGLRHGMASGARMPDVAGAASAQAVTAPLPLRPFAAPPPRPLRIALVSQGYPPRDTAGIARWTQTLAGALALRGHEVHVITAADSARHVDYVAGVWVHAVPPVHAPRHAAPVKLPGPLHARAAAVLEEARQIARDFGLDVLSAPIWDVEGILCAAHLDVPVVTSLHTAYRMLLPMKARWRSDLSYRFNHVERVIAAERWLFAHAALLLANSEEICRELQALYGVVFDAARVVVVPHGLASAPELPPDMAAPMDGAAAPIRVLYVGRIERRKGLDLLLDAMLPLFDRYPGLTLDVVGAPVPEEADYAALIAARIAAIARRGHAARVVLHGHVDEAALLRHYAGCDLFVAPSRFESFGLIAIEAMRFGKPVVAARVGGLAEIVEDGVSGALFTVDSAVSLRKALQPLLTDPARREAAGVQAAARFAARYTRERMAARVEDCLLALVNPAQRDHALPPVATTALVAA